MTEKELEKLAELIAAKTHAGGCRMFNDDEVKGIKAIFRGYRTGEKMIRTTVFSLVLVGFSLAFLMGLAHWIKTIFKP